jgi:hypothetical protein
MQNTRQCLLSKFACAIVRTAYQTIMIAVKGPGLASLTCRNVVASLPLESPDNEGLYNRWSA